MSKIQVKSIALSVLRISGVVLMFAAKAIVYLCIAIAVVGQLLFQEYTQVEPVAATSDPWEEPIENASPVALPIEGMLEPVMHFDRVIGWVTPGSQSAAKTIARPAVLVVDVPDSVKESVAIEVDRDRYLAMSSPELREECRKSGIRWRRVNGQKHLSKTAMVEALLG